MALHSGCHDLQEAMTKKKNLTIITAQASFFFFFAYMSVEFFTGSLNIEVTTEKKQQQQQNYC